MVWNTSEGSQRDAGSGLNALDALLKTWTERQAELQGSQEIKLSTAALSTLLASRNPALNSIQVPPWILPPAGTDRSDCCQVCRI